MTAAIACTPGKGDSTGEEGSTTDGATGSEGTPTTGDSEGGELCPEVQPGAKWDIEFTWNDAGPPGFEPGGESEEELRAAACTVSAVGAGAELTLELACTYAGETEPRAHQLQISLPAGSSLDLAVGETLELEYRRNSHFEAPPTWHLELHREGATVLAATEADEQVFSICFDDMLIEEFSEFGLALTSATCDPNRNERVDFTIDGAATSLFHGTTGPLTGGFVGVVEAALRDIDEGTPTCGYKVLVFLAAG